MHLSYSRSTELSEASGDLASRLYQRRTSSLPVSGVQEWIMLHPTTAQMWRRYKSFTTRETSLRCGDPCHRT